MIKFKINYLYYLTFFILLIYSGLFLDNKLSHHDKIYYVKYEFKIKDKHDLKFIEENESEMLMNKLKNSLKSIFPLDELINKEGKTLFYGANVIQKPFRCSIEFEINHKIGFAIYLILDTPNKKNKKKCIEKASIAIIKNLEGKISFLVKKSNKLEEEIKNFTKFLAPSITSEYSVHQFSKDINNIFETNENSYFALKISNSLQQNILIVREYFVILELKEVINQKIMFDSMMKDEFKSKLEKKSVSSRNRFLILFIYIFIGVTVSLNFLKKRKN